MSLNTPQPKPKPGTGPDIFDLVIADLRERDAIGHQIYGQKLRAGDGRDHLIDAYQEALDLSVYLRQEIQEREQTCPYSPNKLHSFNYRAPYAKKVRKQTTCQYCGTGDNKK